MHAVDHLAPSLPFDPAVWFAEQLTRRFVGGHDLLGVGLYEEAGRIEGIQEGMRMFDLMVF